jgi:hypothetical protein
MPSRHPLVLIQSLRRRYVVRLDTKNSIQLAFIAKLQFILCICQTISSFGLYVVLKFEVS